jgi:GntR family transcriptional regulator/MocR family aminotransferase
MSIGQPPRRPPRAENATSGLARWLPGAVVHGVSAGIQLYVELPPGHDEAAVVEAAAERGVAVEGVAPLRIAGGGPPALVLGFARLPEHRIAEAVRLLADAARRARQRPARRSITGAKASMSPSATTR